MPDLPAPPSAGLSSDRFRAEFPALRDSVHLASCSQGAASVRMTAALEEFQWSIRSEGAPWPRWMAEVEAARTAFAALINAAPDEVAVVGCASDGAFQVASTQDWARRPGVVSTDMEFPSIGHVWLAQERAGARVRYVADDDGTVHADDYAAAIDDTTGLVSVPLVSYRNGLRMPVAEATAAARRHGARVFVDAYQAAGVIPIDVRELDCDYLVAGALKYLLGVPGVAFLYVRGGLADAVPPSLTGWFGRRDPFAFDPRGLDFADTARRFETGTPAIPAVYAAAAGMATLALAEPRAVDAHVAALVDACYDRLAADGRRLWSPKDPALRGPQVALVDDDPDELAALLARRRIFVSPRGHVVRLSFHYYNDAADIEAACRAIREVRGRRS
ncbi:MAG TPA: aminotransferase class V-fold PLP-dependent enzyme [Streptosporangiaceae bacterium]